MNTDSSDLTLMQLSDSFFPSGLYTMSNGLETIFDEKREHLKKIFLIFFKLHWNNN